MNDQNEAFIRRWFEEVWNNKNEAAIDEMLDDNIVAYGLVDANGNTIDSKETFRQLFYAFVDAFPDIHCQVEETMSNENRASARFMVTGTHSGGGLGIAPTGNKVDFNASLTIETKDGKIIKAWNEINFLLMYQQLGAITLTSSSNPNEAVLRRWFEEVWNQGCEEMIDELFPDGVAHGLGEEPVRGAVDYKAFYSAFRGALPDVKVTVEDAVCAGDMVAVRCRAAGTHSGEGIGKRPTNNPVDFNFMAFARIADGKIAEAWNVVDFMKMYSQIDALDLRLDDQ